VVEDEVHIRRAVRNAVAPEFERVVEAGTAEAALDLAAAVRPELIVLDLALPDRPGLLVCQEVRKWSAAPIIVLSVRHSEREKISLLDAGADDYMTKPFSPSELQARVRAQLRRSRLSQPAARGGPIEIGDLSIDAANRVVVRGEDEVHLTPTEWDLLRAFLRHPGKTLTHAQLFRAVWPRSAGDPQQYLRVYVAQLRRKLGEDPVRPRIIITEPGVGYRFTALD
jgi:two-component system KDP operon response regulator KdpE